MICKYCKQEINDNSAVCPFCGRKTVKEKRKPFARVSRIPARNIAALAVLIVAALIFAASVIYNMRPDPFSVTKASVTYITDGSKYVFFYNGKPVDGTYDGEIVSKAESLSGKTLSFITRDGGLYVVSKKGLAKISDNITSYRMSTDGYNIAFRNSVGELYLTKTSKIKPELIDYNVIESNFCLSSDGDTVAYLKTETDGDVMYYYNGKSVRYGKDRAPVLISDNANDVYTVDGSMRLYYSSKFGNERLICDNVEQSFACNSTYKNIIFYSDGETYLFTGKKEPIKLADTKLTLCTVSYAQKSVCAASDYFNNVVTVYGIDNFKDNPFLGNDGKLYYCNSSYSVRQIDENCSNVNYVSATGTAYYLKDSKLCTAKLSSGKISVVADNISKYYLSDKGRYVYFLTNDGKLLAKRGRLSTKEIAQNVSDVRISGYNIVFYTVKNSDNTALYYMKKTEQGKKLSDSISEFGTGASYAFYSESTGNGTVYMYSNGKEKFRQRYQK